MAALDKLIKEAHGMDLNVYVLKYTSISEALVAAHALSSLNRVARLLDGLSEDLRRKVVRHCTKILAPQTQVRDGLGRAAVVLGRASFRARSILRLPQVRPIGI